MRVYLDSSALLRRVIEEPEVVSLGGRLNPNQLRSLDAVHVASPCCSTSIC